MLVIAIDFGTSSSGFAWCWESSSSIAEVNVRSKWQSGFNKYKNYTIMLYYNDDPISWGKQAVDKYTIIQKESKHELHKYTLINSAFKLNIKTKQPIIVNGKEKPITQVVADFLLLMKLYIIEALTEQGVTADAQHTRYCVTLPAIWDDEDRDLMRRAVVQAGTRAFSL